MDVEEVGREVVDASIEVHRELGPGLLESTYERCLFHELSLRGLRCERQKTQPIVYKGLEIDEGYRLDILVEDRLILELKVVDTLNDVHLAQLLTYLKLSNLELGFLLNFNVTLMKHGIRRVVNNLQTS